MFDGWMRDCIKRIVAKSNNTIKAEAARELLEDIDRRAKKKVREGFDYDDAVGEIVKERVENVVENVAKQKANMAKNILIKARAGDKISQFIDNGLSIKDAIRAELEGVNSPIEGTRASLDVQKNAVEHSYLSRLMADLSKEGLLPVLNSKALDGEIGKELWAISRGESVTTSKEAKKIANIIYKTREGQRKRLNKAGADIEQTEGYVMPQRHDTYAMHKMKEDGWVNFMRPLLNEDRSFGGDFEDFDQALRQAYRAMMTGTRLNDPLEDNPKLFQFDGPANLAKKLSQSRQLIFKDYESWKTWNDALGMKDLNEGLLDAVRFDSHNIAMMERYGTNPEAMLKEVVKDMQKKYRKKASDERVEGVTEFADRLIQNSLGKTMLAADPRLARIGSNIRTFQNVTKLGGAVISSVTDIPLKSLEYRFQGRSWLGATVQPFLDVGTAFKSKADKVEFGGLIGVYSESMVGDIAGRFSAQDDLGRKASKVQRIFFKMNGLAPWTDAHKAAMGRVMSHHLGMKKGLEFDGLDADTKRLFGNYGINKEDWAAVKDAFKALEDGREYLLPEFMPAKQREKFIGYFVDRTDFGVLTPSAREQRLATFGQQRGTPMGEFTRLVTQFKSFPLTAVTKVWGRALYGKGKADTQAIVYLALMSSVFGYMATSAKDLLKNRTPKDPNNLETWFAALAQGGGLGILGDVLLQDASFGRSFSSTLAGPTFGTVDDLFKIYSSGIRGEGGKSQALRTAVGAVPFNNLFYARAALDQMILLQTMEELNPGYLRRMESNMKRTYGQELLFK